MGVNVVKLGELCEILDSKRKPVTKKDRVAGEYPYYGATGIQDYVADYIFDEKLVLVGEDGAKWGAGENTAYAISGKCWVNNHAHVLRPNRIKVLDNYLIYYLNQLDLRPYITGAIIEKLNQEQLRNISIPLPTIEEQNRIVTLMDKADEIRAKKKLANDKLDEFLKSTFISMFGDPVKNEKGFNRKPFGGICLNIFGGGTPSKSHPEYYLGNIPWVTPKDMKTLVIEDSIDHINENAIANSSTKLIPVNSILMVIRSGILKHTLPVAINKVNVTVNQDMKAFILNEQIANPLYILYQIRLIEKTILKNVRSVTADNIEFNLIKNLELVIPSIELQSKFAKIVEKVEAQKQKNELVIEQMNNLFNSLSQRAFKGELAQSSSVDLITKQTVLHAKIIDKCNSHQTFGAVKMEKIFNLCDMIQELNLVPGGYYRKAAGPYVPEMRHSVEEKLSHNDWIKTINKGNGKKVEFKKCVKFNEYKKLYYEIFGDKDEKISKIIDYFYDKDTDYCEAFSTLYMCWNDLIIEGKNPSKFEIIDEFKNHWAPEKQRFERIYLLEILSDMSNNHFEPHGQGLHTIDSEYNVNKDQLNLQLK